MSQVYDPVEDIEAVPDEDGGDPGDQATEARARAMGWRPFEEWTGNPDGWKTAQEFVEFADANPGVLRETNRRITKQNERLERRITEMGDNLRRSDAEHLRAMAELRTLMIEGRNTEIEKVRRELLAQRDGAVEAGDMPTFRQIEDELKQLAPIAPASPPPPPTSTTPPPAAAPVSADDQSVINAWIADNPWFNSDAELRKAMIVEHGAVKQLRPNLTLRDQLDRAARRVAETFPDSFDEDPAPMASPPPPPPPPPARRVVAAVARPTGTITPRPRTVSVWDQIPDAAERAVVQQQWERAKLNDPEMPASEYVAIYMDPRADAIELRRRRPKK